MKRTIAIAFYWAAAITIALGAYGHGFMGVKPVRAAIAVSSLPPETVRVIWMVWYFVSGCMLTFGLLLFWAWPDLESRASVALLIGALYAITGVVCWVYSGREPFWLVFLAQGVLVIGSTLVLRRKDQVGG
jgi:hypothetical protein